MAVTDVDLVAQDGWKDRDGEHRTDTYQVLFDAVPTDVAGSVMSADDGGTAIPSILDNFTGSTTIKCKRIGNVRRINNNVDSRLAYYVDVEYDNVLDSTGTVTTNPLSRPAQIDWGFDVIEKVAEKDNADNDIQNSAGDKLDPGLTKNEYRLVCTITQNFGSLDPGEFFDYIDTVNSGTVTIAGVTVTAGQALIIDYSATAVYEGSSEYIQRRISVAFAPTHAVEVADLGYYYIDASDSNKRKRFVDDEGKPDTEPHFLTSGGDDGGGTARYLTFDLHQESNFGALGLPTGFPDT